MATISTLKLWDKAYHENGTPLVSDKRYDRVKDQLREKYPNHKYFKQVGYTPENGKAKLPISMQSLDKLTPTKAVEWAAKTKKKQFVVLPKLDGTAGLLHYRKGKLIAAYTRGDGNIGRNITFKAKFIQGVWPKLTREIDKIGDIYIRGEFCIHNYIFKKIADNTDYKAARNLCTGMLNKKDLTDEDKAILRKMTFVAFGMKSKHTTNKSEEITCLSINNFITPNVPARLSKLGVEKQSNIYRVKNSVHLSGWVMVSREPSIHELMNMINNWPKQVKIGMDGLVITHDVPNGESFAIKLDPEDQKAKIGIVDHVEWNMSDRNILKPVVVLKTPLNFDGAEVSRITAHNAANVKKMEIGKGSKIKIIRSGEVIPRLLKSIRSGTLEIPKLCPNCQGKLSWTTTKTDLFCSNEECIDGAQRIHKFFVTLNADVLGPGNIGILYKAGYKTLPSILRASAKDLAKLEGFGIKKAKSAVKAIRQAATGMPLYKLMQASGIFADAEMSLGGTRLKKLVDKLGEKAVLHGKLPTPAELNKIDSIGNGIANLFIEKLTHYRKWHEEIKTLVEIDTTKTIKKFTGKSFCWTGYRNPEEERYVLENGGEVKNAVTKTLTALFAATPNSSKSTKAKQYNIPVIMQDKAEEYLMGK